MFIALGRSSGDEDSARQPCDKTSFVSTQRQQSRSRLDKFLMTQGGNFDGLKNTECFLHLEECQISFNKSRFVVFNAGRHFSIDVTSVDLNSVLLNRWTLISRKYYSSNRFGECFLEEKTLPLHICRTGFGVSVNVWTHVHIYRNGMIWWSILIENVLIENWMLHICRKFLI